MEIRVVSEYWSTFIIKTADLLFGWSQHRSGTRLWSPHILEPPNPPLPNPCKLIWPDNHTRYNPPPRSHNHLVNDHEVTFETCDWSLVTHTSIPLVDTDTSPSPNLLSAVVNNMVTDPSLIKSENIFVFNLLPFCFVEIPARIPKTKSIYLPWSSNIISICRLTGAFCCRVIWQFDMSSKLFDILSFILIFLWVLTELRKLWEMGEMEKNI